MKKKDSLILVTGAAGMIGSGCVRFLNDLGLENLLLVDDVYESAKWKNLVGKKFVQWLPKGELFSFLEKNPDTIESILHMGACSDTLEKDGDYLLENNYRYTLRLAQYALRHAKRFVYASSAATYGDGKQGFCDDVSLLDTLQPLNMYGYSKHLVDLWMQKTGAFSHVVGLKYFNVFGPNEYHKGHMASMLWKMGKHVREKGEVFLYRSNDPLHFADGEQKRDFIYVKDAVRITCSFLFSPYDKIGGLFNVGRGEAVSWNQLSHALFRSMGKPPKITYIDLPSDLSVQYQNYTCAPMEKLRSEAPKLFPCLSIEDAVEQYVQDYMMSEVPW